MESFSLKPYIKKQILLEADELEKSARKLKELQTTLVWDVLSDKSFAMKLSKWVNLPDEKFQRYGDIPKSKHLSSNQIKNLIQMGPNAGPFGPWAIWDSKKNPPRPGSTSVEKGKWYGVNKFIRWSKAPSGERATPGNMGKLYSNVLWPKEIESLRVGAEGEAAQAVDAAASTVEPEQKMQKMSDADFSKYTWKKYGSIAVAQQMSSWSVSPTKKKSLQKVVRELLKLFGMKEYITGKEAANIYDGDTKVDSFLKVFMSMGVNPDESIISNDQRAFKLDDFDLLKGFLAGKNALYFEKGEGDEFRWVAEPSKTSATSKSTVTRKTLLSKEVDPTKYVPGMLAYASTKFGQEKVLDFIKRHIENPKPFAKIKMGGQKIPANIFYDENYINSHWQHWASAGGGIKTMPIWDKTESRWIPNRTGKSPIEQDDIKTSIRRTSQKKDPGGIKSDADSDSTKSVASIMLAALGLLGPMGAGLATSITAVNTALTAQGLAGAGLGLLGMKYGSLSDEQKQLLTMHSSSFTVAMLQDMRAFQVTHYADSFESQIGDPSTLYIRMIGKMPDLTATQVANFRRTLRIVGTLEQQQQSTKTQNYLDNFESIASAKDNRSFMRSALDMLNEKPFTPNKPPKLDKYGVSAEQLADANTVLSAMGLKGWKFVQPEDNKDEIPAQSDAASTSTMAKSEVNEETGELEHFIVQTKTPQRNPDDEISNEPEAEEVNKIKVPSRTVAEHTVEEISKLVIKTNGFVPPANLVVKAVTTAVAETEVDIGKLENPPDESCEWWWEPGTSNKKISGENGKPGPAFVCVAYKRTKDAQKVINGVHKKIEANEEVKAFVENPADTAIHLGSDEKKNPETKIEPPVPPEDTGLTPEQIKAIIRRLSKGGHKSGPRDPNIAWDDNLQKILKIGANGSTADFKKRWKEVADIVTNSTSPTPPIETLDSVGASVVKAGTPMKMYDDALKSGPGAEIMQQVLDSDPNFAKIWNARKSKTFKLPGHVAIFYYFGWPIQVAVDDKEYVALTGTKTKSRDPKDVSAEQPDIAKHLKVLLGDAQFKAWQQTTKELTRQEKLCLLDMILKGNTLVIAGTKQKPIDYQDMSLDQLRGTVNVSGATT